MHWAFTSLVATFNNLEAEALKIVNNVDTQVLPNKASTTAVLQSIIAANTDLSRLKLKLGLSEYIMKEADTHDDR